MLCCCYPKGLFSAMRGFILSKIRCSDNTDLVEEDREILHYRVCKTAPSTPSDGESVSSQTCQEQNESRERHSSMISTTTSGSSTNKSLDTTENIVGSLKLSLYQTENSENNVIINTTCEGKPTIEENGIVAGYLEFAVSFNEKEKRMVVHVEKATGLPGKGTKLYYDTFVKATYLPSKKNIRVTRTIKSTLNPHFREDLYFHMTKLRNVNGRYIRLSIYDFDRQGRHDAIGHVILPLEEERLKEVTSYKLPLTPKSMPISNLGRLLLSFSYFESQDRLSVTVLRGRNLRLDPFAAKFAVKTLDSFDTYVKVTLMCSGAKVKTVKTAVVHGSHDPSYNQVFHFIVPMCFVDEASVVVTVMVKGLLRQDAVVGRVITGPFLFHHNNEMTQWGLMVHERKAVVQWRTLYL